MSIEQSLERIASALEKLANPLVNHQLGADPTMPPPSPEGAAVLDREQIKAQLEQRGVAYPPRATTETLAKKLEAARLTKKAAPVNATQPVKPAVIVDADPFGAEAEDLAEAPVAKAEIPEVADTDLFEAAAAPAAVVLDFSQFQEECKKLVAVYGKDAFLEALKKVKAAKISDIADEKRNEFIKQLKAKA